MSLNQRLQNEIHEDFARKFPENDYPLAALWAEFFEERQDRHKDLDVACRELDDRIDKLMEILVMQQATIDGLQSNMEFVLKYLSKDK